MTYNKTTKPNRVYTQRISTTVGCEMFEKFHQFNKNKAESDRITWAECIRRGFYSILDERSNTEVFDILESEYVPIKLKERIRHLSDKLNSVMAELDLLKSGSGIVEIKETNKEK